ncbi:unnamed protein product, partial [Rotaria sp. Silwood1]
WQASISGIHRHVIAANSLVRIENQYCFIQVANCSSKPQVLYPGQHLAIADLYDGDNNENTHALSILSLTTTPTSSTFNFNKNDSSHLISCFTELQELSNQGDQKKELFSTSDHRTKHVSQLHDKSNLKYFNNHFLELDSHNTPNSMILPLHSNLSSNTSFNENFNTSTTNSFDFLTNLNLSDTDLTIHQIEQLKSLLVKYYKCFEDTLGRTSLVQHHIDTGNIKPIKLRPYRVSPYRKEMISNEITKMLNAGIIETCASPYAAPITLQPKKDGSLRFCIDYRELNSVTVRDVYPIPRIDDTLDQLQNAKYFSSMYLRSGFWQIELDPASRDKTAFISHADLFRSRVMPFGLTNAPATFQRLTNLVLGGLMWSCALVYLDDIIVYSSSFEDHLHHLELVLQHI